MAEDASEIRQAIERTRDDIGDTIQAIGEKADVKARAGEKLVESRDALKGSAVEATAKLGDVVQRVGDSAQGVAGPAVSSAAEWAKAATGPMTEPGRRRWVAMCAASTALVMILLARRARRSRGQL